MNVRVRCALLAGLLVSVLAGLPSRVLAAGNVNAKIMLRAQPRATHNDCRNAAAPPPSCAGYDPGVHGLQLYPQVYYAFLLVVNGSQAEGVGGLQCGLEYDGGVEYLGGFSPINVYSWTLCATLEFNLGQQPLWPAPGSSNRIVWVPTSQHCTAPPGTPAIGGIGVGGFFYLAAYAPAMFRIVPRPSDGLARVANCAGVADNIYTSTDDSQTFLGALGFGMPGINPCGRDQPVPVVPTTWSGVKAVVGN